MSHEASSDNPYTRGIAEFVSGLRALVNGTQVQGFELEDVHRQGVLHVGAVVRPALIAIA